MSPYTSAPISSSPDSSISSPSRSLSPVASSPFVTPVPIVPTPIDSISIELPLPPHLPCSLNTHPMSTRSKSHCLLSSSHTDVSSNSEPASYKLSLQSPVWTAAMQEKYQALMKQGTWSLVPPPPSKTPIGCKWVFKVKKNSDGTIARHKARLVAKGFLQQEGIDYNETFSPVAKQPTIRVLLCMALHYHWLLNSLT